VTATIPLGNNPFGVVVTQDSSTFYVAKEVQGTVAGSDCRLFAIAALVFCCFAGAQALAQNAYITNLDANTVSVIATATDTVTATIPVGSDPLALAVLPDRLRLDVTNSHDNTQHVARQPRCTL